VTHIVIDAGVYHYLAGIVACHLLIGLYLREIVSPHLAVFHDTSGMVEHLYLRIRTTAEHGAMIVTQDMCLAKNINPDRASEA
jgi:hypothetical protein